jgi:hypothetical protein
MTKTTAAWLRLRNFLFRIPLAFGLVFSLIYLCGLPTDHAVARAGQIERVERIKPESERRGPVLETDRAKAEEIRKAKEKFDTSNTLSRETKLRKFLESFQPPVARRPAPGSINLDPPSLRRFDGFDQIKVHSALQGIDLTPVHDINARFLLDVPMLDSRKFPPRNPMFDEIEKVLSEGRDNNYARTKSVVPGPKEQFANASIVTAAKLEDGTEVLTVFDMAGSFDAGRMVGRMEPLSKDTDNTARVRKIIGELGPGARVYFYGNELRNIDLTTIANEAGLELVRRANTTRDLLSVQQRLNTIASRDFDPERTVIVNGLPESEEAVASMGPFAGRAETWLKFRESIDANTRPDVRTSSKKGVLFRELQQGDSDLVVLVAHSDGLHIYLNNTRVSLEEIRNLPNRKHSSDRPRQAIIISCNAGKVSSPSVWRRIFRREYTPLGRLLVEKGFVDQVIAPDHQIDAAETLETFKKALSGATHLTFEHWNRIAVSFRPHYGVVS